MHDIIKTELGKASVIDDCYNPERLFPIDRNAKRIELGINPHDLPFKGFDCWNHYEVSWLNEKGKPKIGIGELYYDCKSPKLIESKSLKLYFNSFNNTKIDQSEFEATVINDIEARILAPVRFKIYDLDNADRHGIAKPFQGRCIDDLDIECSLYGVNPALLQTEEAQVEEVLHSHLLRSNCLITNQPDWGSVEIRYAGSQINHASLLQYLVSFRNHNEFHEQCIERIFVHILQFCKPKQLTVYGRYTRRGGLDINPLRTTETVVFENQRLIRQ